MHYEDKRSLWNIDVLASFAVLVGMLIRYRSLILGHITGSAETGIERYSYFMLGITALSLLILAAYCITNRNTLVIWLPVLFVFSAFVSTALSGLYPVSRLPFRFIEMFYWVAVMLLSYYAVLHLKTMKFHVAIVTLMLPLLAYGFYAMRHSESVYSGTLLLNPVYYIAYLMPVVLLLRSNILKVGGLLLIFAIVVLSYKRMAIVAYMSSILVYFYFLSLSGEKAKFWRIIVVAMSAVGFVGVLALSFRYLGFAFGLDWSGRMSGMVESGGSGRIDIYKNIISAMVTNPSYLLFGHGYLGTYEVLGKGAHNDFLEILYDFGLIGLTLYSLFVGKLIKIFFEMKKLKYTHQVAYAVSLVWFAWGSMFSQLVIFPYWFLSLAMFWGITIADFENAKNDEYFTEINDTLYEYEYHDDQGTDEPYA